jgi:uncharacterized protein (DUF58 family)
VSRAGPIALALAVITVGVVADIPALVPVGMLVGALATAQLLWLRRGLRGFEYSRVLGTRHAVWGDRVPVTVTIWNRSWLPVAWLTADDQLSGPIRIGSAPAPGPDDRHSLRNVWTLWPFERIERRFLLEADHRGRVAFGPVRLAAADLFAGTAASGELDSPAELTVAPRSVPVRMGASRARWNAQPRPTEGFPEDPAHVSGVRPYQAGDSPRRIHWRATARTGTARSKRFETSRERELMLVLDMQTLPGRAVGGGFEPDLVESLCVAAASLARDAITSGVRCGLAAAAFSYRLQPEVRMLPAGGPRQLLALDVELARLSGHASGPFQRLLAGLPRWVPTDVQLVVLSARDPAEYLPAMRRLRLQGHDLRLVAVGPDAATIAAHGRAAGIRVLTADLSPDWRTTDALSLAG